MARRTSVAAAALAFFACIGAGACRRETHPACAAASFLLKTYPVFKDHGCSTDGKFCALGLDPALPAIDCGPYKIVAAGSSLRPSNVCRAPVVFEADGTWHLQMDAWVTVEADGTGVVHLRTLDDSTIPLTRERVAAAELSPPMSAMRFNALFAADPAACAGLH